MGSPLAILSEIFAAAGTLVAALGGIIIALLQTKRSLEQGTKEKDVKIKLVINLDNTKKTIEVDSIEEAEKFIENLLNEDRQESKEITIKKYTAETT